MATRFKICGVRTAADIAVAVEAGAAAVGLNFYPPSPRCLELDEAARLAGTVPLWVDTVAVFVSPALAEVERVLARTGAGAVQLHGELSRELCAALRRYRIIVALPVVAGETVARVAHWRGVADALLLDAAVAGQHGGTGRTADWDAARQCVEAAGELPIVLAGGLTPDNVREAIRVVRPYAVDVASGVESAPGVKDPERIRAFAAAVREAG